jgi:hypothetical protein
MDAAGHVVRAHVIDAPDDDAATEQAKQYVDGHDVEVWELSRQIAHLRHKTQ